jgi:predicted CxxxxCH...CXXCH cytochrome family protein
MQTFALVGAHQAVSCEGCHPYEPPFTAQVGTCQGLGVVPVGDPLAGCLTCHECDRPVGHYPGQSCGEAGCHATLAPLWAPDGGGGGTEDGCLPACHLQPVRPGGAPDDASHAGHLDGTTVRTTPLVCGDCHPPGEYADPATDPDTHENAVVDVVMESPLARFDGAVPAYVDGTCSGTYCHGATMTVPPELPPVWNDPAFDAAACDECHGWPPPPPHAPTGCATCHSPTVSSDLPELADKTPHMDGCVQALGEETPSGADCP